MLALAGPAAVAATLGHSHLVSVLGQPLQIHVQLNALTPDDQRSLKVQPAPARAWAQSGLTPPVDLSSLRFHVADGYAAATKVIQVRSDLAFDQPVADLLLDVSTAAGQQRFQVSLLTQGGSPVAPGATARGEPSARSAGAASADRRISVKWGDTMFSIASRHAVPGVSVYQMMIALQRANPQAFIDGNLNLVKAGATLRVPGVEALTAISDREARRLFIEQAQAFAHYRQRAAASVSAADGASASSGAVTTGGGDAPAQPHGEGPRDQLRLSGGANGANDAAATRADDALAARKGIEDSSARVSQLEANVRDLNEALQAQGDAAGNLVLEGARGLTDSLAAASDGQGESGDGAGQGTLTGQATGSAARGAEGGVSGKPGAGDRAAGNGRQASSASSPGDVASQGGGEEGDPGQRASDGRAAGEGAGSTGAGAGVDGTAAEAAASGAAGSQAAGSAAAGTDAAGSAVSDADASSSGAAGSDAAGSDAAGSGAAAGGAAGASATGVNGSGQGDDASSSAGATGDSDSTSSKADTSVSWLQEHMLGVITGALALIVLIIAWLLRRANSARNEGSDGVITEAMVQEKLNQIDLEFTEPPAGGPRSPER